MADTRERLDSLEHVLNQFIVNTERAFNRYTAEVSESRIQTDKVIQESRIQTDKVIQESRIQTDKVMQESRIQTDKALNQLSSEMKDFKEEMRKDRKKSEKEMRDFKEEMRKDREKSEKEMRDFKEEMRKDREEAKEERKKMNKQWGELARKWGTIAEDIVAPSVREIAEKYFGCIEIEDFMVRRFKQNTKDKSKSREFDVIAVCPEEVLIIEVKSTPKINYINDFLASLQEVFDYFPEYAYKKLIPIFSSLYIPDNTVKYLTRNKIYAMAIGEELMEIVNFDSLQNI